MEFFNSDWLYLYMPIAGVKIFWPGLVLIGFSVGTIGGFFGMGGAWMVTPGLNILGFPMAFAIGTDMAHIAGKSMISTMRHSKFGNVDSIVRWVYVAFLALIAWMVFYDYAKATRQKKAGLIGEHGAKGITWYTALHRIKIPPMVNFRVAGFTCSVWLPIGVSFITGLLAGFLGIGGGLLRMPALVYLIGCPTHIAVGTDLFEVMISGLYGAFTYSLKGRIEIVAVFVMLTGAAIGAQIGTVATKYAQGYGIRVAFGTAVVCCMLSVILKEFRYNLAAAVLILSTIGVICIYIIQIFWKGAAEEFRSKRSLEQRRMQETI